MRPCDASRASRTADWRRRDGADRVRAGEHQASAGEDSSARRDRLVLEEGYLTSAAFRCSSTILYTSTDGADSTTPEVMEPTVRTVACVIEARLAAI